MQALPVLSALSPADGAPAARPEGTRPENPLARSAQALETAFLAEMLKAAGHGRVAPDADGGDEDAFASFMADAQAQAMMARGGIGLASHIERALAIRQQEGTE